MQPNVKLIYYIQQYLELLQKDASLDTQDALEAASSALEDAYLMDIEPNMRKGFECGAGLEEIFKTGIADVTGTKKGPVSDADKARAVEIKTKGNDAIRAGNVGDAIDLYTQAIEIDEDPVYYCNRAAGYMKLEQHEKAMADCCRAIEIDPTYAKAFSRMGAISFAQEDYRTCITHYRRALALDPDNEVAKSNLAVAKAKLEQADTRPAPSTGGLDLGGPGGLLNNPALQGLMGQMMGGAAPQTETPAEASAPVAEETSGGDSSVDSVLDGLFSAFPAFASLKEDPDFIRLKESGKLQEIARAVQSDGPMAAMRFMSDPDVSPIISKVMGNLGGMGGLASLFGGMGGGAPSAGGNTGHI